MAKTHVISAVVEKRFRLMGEAIKGRFQIVRREADIAHIDAVIKMFKPGYDLEAVLPKTTFRKNPAGTPGGSGSRHAMTVLREFGIPLETREIALRVLARLNKPVTDDALHTLTVTIQSTFTRRKDGAVVFDARTRRGTWTLSTPSLLLVSE